MNFFKVAEYPQTYLQDHQDYWLARQQLVAFSHGSKQDQKYNSTLLALSRSHLTNASYPNPTDRPLKALTKDDQKKIKKEIELIDVINAIEQIHQRTVLLMNGLTLRNNSQIKPNCIYLYRENDGTITYKCMNTNGQESLVRTNIQPTNFLMTTILAHKQDILNHAQHNKHILPSNIKPTQAELAALNTHINTLKTIQATLNSRYIGYAYHTTFVLMAASVICAFTLMLLGLVGAIFPFAPLISLTFLIPATCFAYLAAKALIQAEDIHFHEAPLKTNLEFYIRDNETLMIQYNEKLFSDAAAVNSV